MSKKPLSQEELNERILLEERKRDETMERISEIEKKLSHKKASTAFDAALAGAFFVIDWTVMGGIWTVFAGAGLATAMSARGVLKSERAKLEKTEARLEKYYDQQLRLVRAEADLDKKAAQDFNPAAADVKALQQRIADLEAKLKTSEQRRVLKAPVLKRKDPGAQQ